MSDYNIDERVDITDMVCPMTFVKAKVALEEIEIGQVLAVTLNEGEPAENVPRSFKEEGQEVLDLIDNGNGTYDLIVKKLEE
jgi:TusA-related sulfurtransferase